MVVIHTHKEPDPKCFFGPPAPKDFVHGLHIAENSSSLLAYTDYSLFFAIFALLCSAERNCCLMQFVLSLEGCWGHMIKSQRHWEVEMAVFRFCYLLELADHGTSLSLHSAAEFRLEVRILLSSKITWVNNHRGNNSVNCWVPVVSLGSLALFQWKTSSWIQDHKYLLV